MKSESSLRAARDASIPWVPAALCFTFQLITLYITIAYGADPGSQVLIYGNIAMCFFFVGYLASSMRSEIRELRQRLAKLELRRDVDDENLSDRPIGDTVDERLTTRPSGGVR